jgi:hypothetical protein
VPAEVLTAAVAPSVARVRVELLADSRLWGKEIDDERYVLLAST